MGLSNASPKETVGTYQVLLDIAAALKTLTDDPKALQNAITDAYALTDKEQAKAGMARAETEKYEDLVLEQKANLDELAKRDADLNSKIADFTKAQDKFYDDRALLAQRENAYNANVEQLNRDLQNLQKERNKLEADKSDLAAQCQLVAQQQKDLDEAQALLKSKADQLKVLTEGL